MAEYTLKQAIDKLERNPNLKFKFVAEESYRTDEGAVIALDKDGRVVNEEGKSILSNFSIRSKFRLVNEPVDRMIAFKAFEKGKTIYCEYNNDRLHYKPRPSNKITALENIENQEPVSIEEILYGEWFIEGE